MPTKLALLAAPQTIRTVCPATVGETTLTEAQMPSHTHTFGIGTYGSSAEAKGNTSSKQRTDATGGSQAHTHILEGASDEVSNIPPYYALSFIMRTA